MRIHNSLLSLASFVAAKDVVHNWDITYVTSNRGLDQAPKRGIGINGQFPLPVVEATLGDTLVLNIHNSLDQPTSLHSHGLLQKTTNYYDGASMTTECSTAPGANFTYRIPLQQAGSYWIHSHTNDQNFDGLRTPLIVHDPLDPYTSDEEFLFAVEDWSPLTMQDTVDILLGRRGNGSIFDPPPGILVNGAGGALTRPLYFKPGSVYRIRLVSMMSLPLWEFTIDDHELQIVEVDGVYTKPKRVNVVRMSPAQRVSVLVRAKSAANLNYKYHITMFGDFLPSVPGVFPSQYDGGIIYSHYAPYSMASAVPSEPFDELAIESLDDVPALTPDRSIYMNVTSGFTLDGRSLESFNFVTYSAPKVPTMFSALTMGKLAQNPIIYGPQTNPYVLKHGEVIELVLWNAGIRPHPLHLHGHVFQVVERGLVSDTTGALRSKVPEHGFSPLQRDTVLVADGEYVVIRFRADNPGAWLFHCHFDIHMALGLSLVFIEAPELMQDTINVPQSVIDQCVSQGKNVSGNVVGQTTFNYDGAPSIPNLLANKLP